MSRPSPFKLSLIVSCIVAIAGVAAVALLRTNSTQPPANASSSLLRADTFQTLSAQQRDRIQGIFGGLPLAFEANEGQSDPEVKYIARGSGYTAFLAANETVFALASRPNSFNRSARWGPRSSASAAESRTAAIHMQLVGSNPHPHLEAEHMLPGITNYYIGNDPRKWHQGVKQYAAVSYEGVFPGVDLAFHGEQHQLEFDFVIQPKANPNRIALRFSGASKLATDSSGNLALSSSTGDVVLHKPLAYQVRNGLREIVEAAFQLQSRNQVAFTLGTYDHGRELVIDPALTYATYLGGSGEDEALAIAVDSSGNIYVAGQTASINFPAHTGTVSTAGLFDAFVTKIAASGTSLGFTTLLGGSGNDAALGIAVNSTGTYVIGDTDSTTFPTTVANVGPLGNQDLFVASLNSTTGTPIYVTRIGGSQNESGNAIAADSSGNAYIAGETFSSDFPTASPIYGSNAGSSGTGDAFVAKLNSSGNAFVFSTYLGGSADDLANGIALDSSNNIYVAGDTISSNFPTTSGVFQTSLKGTQDAFISEIAASGSALKYSTYLGGSSGDNALAIAVDSAGEAYVAGNTNSSDFPILNAAQPALGAASAINVFVSKINSGATSLLFSTYYGGNNDDEATGIALDAFGDVYVTGRVSSTNFPVSGSPFQANYGGGQSDAFVTEFSNSGFVVYSSFLGGTGDENTFFSGGTPTTSLGAVAVDAASNAYLAGNTDSTTGFTTVSPLSCCTANAGGQADAFVAKVAAAPADFSVSVAPNSISVTSGQTTSTITVTVSSVNASYGKAVTLSCAGVPSKAACDFTQGSVTPGTSSVTSSLTITTDGSSGSGMLIPGGSRIYYAALFPLIGFVFLGISPVHRRRAAGLLLITLMFVGLLLVPACSSGSSGGGGGGGGGGNNTPPGSYTITVSGAAGGTTHSTTLMLDVH